MNRYASLVVRAAAVPLLAGQRHARSRAERLAAATLETLLNAIDANDANTGAHVRRVADYALTLAEAADLDEKTQRSIERVALFHDIGKITGALTDIVKEPTALTRSERRGIMTHPRRGADVLSPLASFHPDLPEGVLSHHERWNGSGYPRHLKGRRIPIAARVVAIADTFDAITHSRPNHPARSLKAATDVIAAGRATEFDPELVDLFLSPPVLECIAASMRAAHSSRRVNKGRRKAGAKTKVPDLTFRWRTTAP